MAIENEVINRSEVEQNILERWLRWLRIDAYSFVWAFAMVDRRKKTLQMQWDTSWAPKRLCVFFVVEGGWDQGPWGNRALWWSYGGPMVALWWP